MKFTKPLQQMRLDVFALEAHLVEQLLGRELSLNASRGVNLKRFP